MVLSYDMMIYKKFSYYDIYVCDEKSEDHKNLRIFTPYLK